MAWWWWHWYLVASNSAVGDVVAGFHLGRIEGKTLVGTEMTLSKRNWFYLMFAILICCWLLLLLVHNLKSLSRRGKERKRFAWCVIITGEHQTRETMMSQNTRKLVFSCCSFRWEKDGGWKTPTRWLCQDCLWIEWNILVSIVSITIVKVVEYKAMASTHFFFFSFPSHLPPFLCVCVDVLGNLYFFWCYSVSVCARARYAECKAFSVFECSWNVGHQIERADRDGLLAPRRVLSKLFFFYSSYRFHLEKQKTCRRVSRCNCLFFPPNYLFLAFCVLYGSVNNIKKQTTPIYI